MINPPENENSQIFEKSKITLESAFKSTFHDSYSFKDFLSFKVENEISVLNFKLHQKTREIIEPSPKFKKYLRFLKNFIFDYYLINDRVVYSYQNEKNTLGAIKKHASSHFFLKADIKNFFSSICEQDVRTLIENNLKNTPISDVGEYKERLIELSLVNTSLPIGFATSPVISNSVLLEFDNALEKYCSHLGIIYTRYADDLILSSNNKNLLPKSEKKIESLLKTLFEQRIQLNKRKTRYFRRGQKIKLLGMTITINGHVTVNKHLKKELEVLLYFYVSNKNKFNDYLTKNFEGSLAKVSGKLNYINTIDINYLKKLRLKYGNYVVDKFIHLPKQHE
jgi:RNA-directed DNA polymerase